MTVFEKKYFFMGKSHEIYLEIVSRKSPESRPKIAQSEKSMEKVSGISPESPSVFLNSFRDLPIWVKGTDFRVRKELLYSRVWAF